MLETLAVPKVGVEPTWAKAHYALNVARLPIPPLRQKVLQGQFYPDLIICQPSEIKRLCWVQSIAEPDLLVTIVNDKPML